MQCIVELIFTVFVSFTSLQGSIMYWSHAWIMSTVLCLAFYITAVVNAEWSSDSSKKGSLKLLRKTLLLHFRHFPRCFRVENTAAKNICSKVRFQWLKTKVRTHKERPLVEYVKLYLHASPSQTSSSPSCYDKNIKVNSKDVCSAHNRIAK